MNPCARCTIGLETPISSGTLYLAPPLSHTVCSIRKSLGSCGIHFDEPETSIISVDLAPGRLAQVLSALNEKLGEAEQRDTRSLIVGEGVTPSLTHLLETIPLATLIAKVQGDWLFELIREERLTSHFQPIVRTETPGEVHAYECLLRGQDVDDSLIAPTRMYDAARSADLIFQLDRAARLTAIREAVRHQIGERLFINFNPSSVYDPNYCLKSTIAAIDEAGFAPDRIVFEVVESDQSKSDLLQIMTTYRRAGFRVALDDLGAGYGSLNLLSQLRPDVVKLDMELVRDIHLDPYQASITAQILEMAQKLGIETVAEGIETAEEWRWFREHGATYVQGYYFARPASPPPRPCQPSDPDRDCSYSQVEIASQAPESVPIGACHQP